MTFFNYPEEKNSPEKKEFYIGFFELFDDKAEAAIKYSAKPSDLYQRKESAAERADK